MSEPYDPLDELTAMMAATVAAREEAHRLGYPKLDDRILHAYRDIVLPAHARSVRESVAEDLEDVRLDHDLWPKDARDGFLDWDDGLESAAAIARGGKRAAGEWTGGGGA